MDSSANIVFAYLSHQGFKEVVYEPDGNVPPDFLLDGRIAVEVRRLNQNEQTVSGPHGLEEVAKPLWTRMNRLVESLGPPTASAAGTCAIASDVLSHRGSNWSHGYAPYSSTFVMGPIMSEPALIAVMDFICSFLPQARSTQRFSC